MKVIAALVALGIGVSPVACGETLELPRPTGNYPVGTRYLHFVDHTRPEPFTSNPTDNREVTVRAWYPGQSKKDEEAAPYLINAADIVRTFNLSPSLINLETHSMLESPLSEEERTFPVLIFNHGWGEHFSQNTVLMEELASHGYIVFSIAHHYEAKFSFYPDGTYITMDLSSERFRKIMEEQKNPEAFAIFETMSSAETLKEQEEIFRDANRLMPTSLVEGPRLWSSDIRFLVDELEKLNESGPMFKGKLDLERLGVFGMSAGGIASGLICTEDERFKAGINMDGGIYGDLVDLKIPQPFMFMNSERYRGYDDLFLSHVDNTAYNIIIEGSGHQNFSDLSIIDPSAPLMGTIDGYRMLEILNDYTRAFFDKYLRGIESSLLSEPSSEYPEVRLETKNAE